MTGRPVDDAGPPDDEGVAETADDRFVHGLLGFLHHDEGGAQTRRIERVMDAVVDERQQQRMRFRRRRITHLGSIAVMAAMLIGAVVLLGLPTEQTANAFVNLAIEAGRAAGDRRYDIKVETPDGAMRSIGTIDLRRGDMVIRMKTPEGHVLVAGRDHEGEWMIRRDGSAERYDANRGLPRWISLGDETILVESVDTLLEQLADGYDLDLAADGHDPGVRRIVATRAVENDRPGPSRVELLLSVDTDLLEKMTLQWERPGDGERGEGQRPLRDQGRDRRRPPRDGRRGPPRQGPPDAHGGPPGEGGHDRPPPRRIEFALVNAPELVDGWFAPELHAWSMLSDP